MTKLEQFVLNVFEPKFYSHRQHLSHDPFPTGYGIAYKCYDRDGWVLYPIPVHILVRIFKWMWAIVIKWGYPNVWERMMEQARKEGYEMGLKQAKFLNQEELNKALSIADTAVGMLKLSFEIGLKNDPKLS